MDKYRVIVLMGNIKMTLEKTQSELAKLLLEKDIKLISVNDSGTSYYRTKKKNK